MSDVSLKKKKINLCFLLLIVLFIIAFIITIINILNSSKASTYSSYIKKDEISLSNEEPISSLIINENTVAENINNEDSSGFGQIYSYTQFYDMDDIETNENEEIIVPPQNEIVEDSITNDNTQLTTEQTESTNGTNDIILNNHKYTFDSNKNVILKTENSNKYIQINNENYTIKLNTDKRNYYDLKKTAGLKSILQKNYKVSFTSNLKTGTIKNTDLIVAKISENGNNAYFFITPLNDAEIIYFKVYNTNDTTKLIEDLSGPINEILSLKSIIE